MVVSCPVCGADDRTDVLSLPQVPVLINAQVKPEEAMSVRRGDIELVVCHGCGHLYNRSFDESLLDYDAAYENTLHFSPSFQTFAAGLADRLIADHDLAGATVAELGSGPGHFLSMLCDRGARHGYGFDPSYDPGRLGAPEHPAVTISTERFPDDGSLPVELAFSQHVLEHLHDPVAALAAQRAAVAATGGTGGVVYSEVPNGALMVEQCALWDLIFEHLSYFVPTSFATAHRRAGLELIDTGADFGEQFMWATSRPGTSVPSGDVDAVARAVAAATDFGDEARARIAAARHELLAFAEAGPVALWGAGSKGMTYLNLIDGDHAVSAVIDINPRKAGWGVPGTRHRIGGIELVDEVQPVTVIAANPVYAAEIGDQIATRGVSADVVPLWG